MKKIILTIGIIISSFSLATAQVTTAMDFTKTDCNSISHSLFADYLDSGEVCIMEFFMLCGSCATAGQKLDPMYMGLTTQYPGLVNFFAIAYNNSYTCSTVNTWKNTNTPNATPFTTGATEVAYYGGMGMPTVVVVGGSNHQVIYNSNYDGAAGDTAAISAAIDNFFATMGVENANNNIQFSAYPNPTINMLNLELTLINPAQTQIEMVDMMGRVVKEISNKELSAGLNTMQVETADLVNGIYFIRMSSTGKTTQYKISVKH